MYARGLSPIANTELSLTEFGGELDRYLERFAAVKQTIIDAEKYLRPELGDAYYAAIKYPVLAAEAQARKMLEAQRARSYATGSTRKGMFDNNDALCVATAKSQEAYQDIRQLTEYYNNVMAGGKWRNSMNMRPRDLPVFAAPSLPLLLSDTEKDEWLKKASVSKSHPIDDSGVIAHNAADFDSATEGTTKVSMLGHSMNAVALPKNGELHYKFEIGCNGDYTLLTALIPTQPNDKGDLRYSVSVDGAEPTVFSLKEKFRSEQWKLNVLCGQARRSLRLKLSKGTHKLVIKALDNHIIVDQWMIDNKGDRKFYLFPVK